MSEGGEATVKATWLADEAAPTFNIALDTHSMALDGYDLRELAVLRAEGREISPASWEAPAGGHHCSGTLVFPATAADGTPLLALAPARSAITAQMRLIELVIRDIGDVPERVITWAH